MKRSFLNIFRWAFSGVLTDGGPKSPLPKICNTSYNDETDTLIPYLKKIQKICKSYDTPLELC